MLENDLERLMTKMDQVFLKINNVDRNVVHLDVSINTKITHIIRDIDQCKEDKKQTDKIINEHKEHFTKEVDGIKMKMYVFMGFLGALSFFKEVLIDYFK